MANVVRNFDAVLLNRDGTQVFDFKRLPNGRVELAPESTPQNPIPVLKDSPVTIKERIAESLDSPLQEDANQSFSEKKLRGNLTDKIWKGGDIELTTDEVGIIEARCAKTQTSLVCQQIAAALDKELA